MICVQCTAATPIVRAFDQGAADIEPKPPGRTIATGLNVAQNLGHINVLRIIRETGGCAVAVTEEAIRETIRDEWRERRTAWSPEGAATLAALPELADRGMIRRGDRVVLVNTASAEKVYAGDPRVAGWGVVTLVQILVCDSGSDPGLLSLEHVTPEGRHAAVCRLIGRLKRDVDVEIGGEEHGHFGQ